MTPVRRRGPVDRAPFSPSFAIALAIAAIAAATVAWTAGAADATPVPPPAVYDFAQAVANVEFLRAAMLAAAPRKGLTLPATAGATWYGQITRRLESDLPGARTDHFVPFVVEYVDGVAARAWCDADLDGDLTDQPPVTLARHPLSAGARSFLVTSRWTARDGARSVPVEATWRVVLEEAPRSGEPRQPLYRLQAVFAMTGRVTIDGASHQAFLFDGDGDGLYGRGLGDGLYVDLDDDRAIDVDPMGDEFVPFAVPAVLGSQAYEITGLDPEGRSMAMRALGPAPPRPAAPAIGAAAPEVAFTASDGREVRLSGRRG
ncbi:MAG TPA: hypothetical protein VMQ62_12170, partial [Dongiaceae bacterium]|nr:hypothetical protein [Dongiaceae bacterium]